MAHCILVTNHQKSQNYDQAFVRNKSPKFTILGSRVLGPLMGEDLISSEVQQLFEVFIVQCALIVATRTTVFTVALLLVG